MAAGKSKKQKAIKKAVKKSSPSQKNLKVKATHKTKTSSSGMAAKKVKVSAKKTKSPAKKAAGKSIKSQPKKAAVKKAAKTTSANKGKTSTKTTAAKKSKNAIPAKSPEKNKVKNKPVKGVAVKNKEVKANKENTGIAKKDVKEIKKGLPGKSSSASIPSTRSKIDKNTVDPLQAKAEKVIKELEETMDLSRLRPRISTGTSAPKPLQKHIIPPVKLPEPQHTTKEKFQIEFEFRSSPKILFTSLSDSSGLAGWFADEVHTKDDVYTFVWEGGESTAKLVAIRDLQLVRFQWLDDTDGTYFQFEIKEDDITSDIALLITDFANPGERETSIRLWESQVQKLRMLLGSL